MLLVVAVVFIYDINKIFCYNLRLMNIGKSRLFRFQMPYEKWIFQKIGSRLFVCWCSYFVEDIKRDIPLNHRSSKMCVYETYSPWDNLFLMLHKRHLFQNVNKFVTLLLFYGCVLPQALYSFRVCCEKWLHLRQYFGNL